MKVIETIEEMKSLRKDIKSSVGFVPTMGYLHQGHLSLIKQSKIDNQVTVTSIYVNPSQFGQNEDFNSYPRDIERDLNLLKETGNDLVFMPTNQEMYPENYHTWVEVEKITNLLEGGIRPGHFRGVTTIVAKLFNIVQPDRAYFGQKDAQQVVVIKKMVDDLNMNLQVIVLATIREIDGLAMSSRNVYLNPAERKAASILYQSLLLAKQLKNKGVTDTETIRQQMVSLINKEPLASIQYVSIAHNQTLEELPVISNSALVSLAVKFGKTRLIDNMII